MKILKKIIIKLLTLFFNRLSVRKNTIIFRNIGLGNYSCNLKYIAEEIVAQKLPLKIYWVLNDKVDKSPFPKSINFAKRYSLKYFYILATSNVIVANSRFIGYFSCGFKKKKHQFYMQTWHGSLGIKKIGSASNSASNELNKIFKSDSDNTDVLLSNSKWGTGIFDSSFLYDGEIAEIGSPRNDVFFRENKHIADKVRGMLKISSESKIAFYAPTFRQDGDCTCFNLDYKKLKSNLEKKFGGNWVVVVRLHPEFFIRVKDFKITNDFIDATNYPDIQELMLATDLMITDYSSCIYDFVLTLLPAFIYAEDVEKYNTERGFYYPLEETPFPIATSNEELAEKIAIFDYEAYKERAKNFIKGKGSFDDGNASKKAVEIIKKHLGIN